MPGQYTVSAAKTNMEKVGNKGGLVAILMLRTRREAKWGFDEQQGKKYNSSTSERSCSMCRASYCNLQTFEVAKESSDIVIMEDNFVLVAMVLRL